MIRGGGYTYDENKCELRHAKKFKGLYPEKWVCSYDLMTPNIK